MPSFTVYSKLASANQNTSLAGVYEQVTYTPTFSGIRQHTFSTDFFTHIQKQSIKHVTGRTINQLENALGQILTDLREMVYEKKLDCVWGSVDWYREETVWINDSKDKSGAVEFLPEAKNRFFLAKSSR